MIWSRTERIVAIISQTPLNEVEQTTFGFSPLIREFTLTRLQKYSYLQWITGFERKYTDLWITWASNHEIAILFRGEMLVLWETCLNVFLNTINRSYGTKYLIASTD